MSPRSLLEEIRVPEDQHDSDLSRDSLIEKLSAELSVASWSALAPHAERGALFWVDRTLNIVDVAVSFALDDARSVEAWHQAGLLLPASSSSSQDFAAFEFLIVQPFVLATPLELPPGGDHVEN
jgi:hypothetical protein